MVPDGVKADRLRERLARVERIIARIQKRATK
jgi:hypothetical protein